MASQSGKCILIVDDDAAYRRLVVRMLATSGLEIVTADNFSDALAIIESDREVDLLLTDVVLQPGTPHGFSMGNMAQLRRRSLRILYMSGSPDVPQYAMSHGTALLQKPFTQDALLSAIATALG